MLGIVLVSRQNVDSMRTTVRNQKRGLLVVQLLVSHRTAVKLIVGHFGFRRLEKLVFSSPVKVRAHFRFILKFHAKDKFHLHLSSVPS